MIASKLTPTAAASLIAALAATVLYAVPAGAAEEPTREGYVASAESICKRSTNANQRKLAAARRLIRRNRLKPAGRRLARVARVFNSAVRRIAGLPRPTADAATLTRWIRLLKKQAAYLRGISKALLAGNRPRASRLEVRRSNNRTQANNAVLGFGFKSCRVRQ